MDSIVGAYRQILVLTENIDQLDAMIRDRVEITGRLLFQENQERLEALSTALCGQAGDKNPPDITAFLNRVENTADYHDADKLVFRELFDDLAAAASEHPSATVLKKRLSDDVTALDQIQALYEKELAQSIGQLQSRGIPIRREAWESYLSFIKTQYQREQILKQYESALPPSESRGAGKRKKKANSSEIMGSELPPKTLLLTFDDGPHPRYTDQILEILKKYQLQAVFFEVGRNLGTVGKDGKIKLTKAADASYRILAQGSVIANHSFTHPVLSKLNAAGYTQEIDSTNVLLKYILNANPVLFRPPYGATNSKITTLVQSEQMKSMLWNIDSLDWADPVANSITQRVLGEIDREGRGIILFHDIHNRAIAVLPKLIETLQAQGYQFASWSGTGFSTSTKRGIQIASQPEPVAAPYHESWAAVIGIDDYQSWPKLRYATHDAEGVRDLLLQKYNFKPDHVFTLLDHDATRENILSLLGDKLGNPNMVQHEDRVFVFFAGHGATRKLSSGRDLGYIIPVDADLTSYEGRAISMTNFQDIAEAIPAKHLLFVMDSCYSGLALTRGGAMPPSQNYLQEIARREARQMFTAGGADQQVADNGPNGHSVFTWTLLQALDGRADLNGDGFITATELAAYVAPAVSSLSQQTPAFGNLPGSEGGDFIFDLKHDSEFLNSDSNQLSDEAIRLNAEVEQLRQQNQDLMKQLAQARATSQEANAQMSRGKSPAESALSLNDDGLRLYKEKKYDEAAAVFIHAAELDPKNSEATNNAGFALYRSQKYDEAVTWFQRAIVLDSKRAVAYLNLGDAYFKLNRSPEARQAYEKYLELAPSGRAAAEVREKLKALGPG